MKTLALFACVLAAGCVTTGDDPAADETETGEAPEADTPQTPDTPVGVPEALRMRDSAVNRPVSGLSVVDDYVADCTYIQWCNAPGPERVVCVLKSSCVDLCHSQQGYDSVISQCQNDADYVCGTHSTITYKGCYR